MFDVLPVTSPKPMDCGATCLKMLLAYYGQDVELDELAKKCNTRIIGCTAADINRVGLEYGLDMKAFRETAEDLMKQDRPAIIWWKYAHFVVFCGLDEDGKVVICNPDIGRYRMSKETFSCFFTEIALCNGTPEDLPEGEAV